MFLLIRIYELLVRKYEILIRIYELLIVHAYSAKIIYISNS